jgi:hypothetical protein
MVFILHMKGATAHEGQIGRIAWRLPYWRYLKVGCRPSIYIAPTD